MADLLNALANLYCSGLEIDWTGFDQDYQRCKVELPTYPFQRKRFWSEPLLAGKSPRENTEIKREAISVGNPWGGELIHSPITEKQIEYSLSLDTIPDLRDTGGLLHVGYYLELLSQAIQKLYHDSFSIQTIEFLTTLVIPDSGITNVSLILSPTVNSEIAFSFYSCQGNNNWNKHTQGTIQLGKTNRKLPVKVDLTIEELKSTATDEYSGEVFYQKMQSRGLLLGNSVQWIDYVWSGAGEALARFRLPEKPEMFTGYEIGVHPGIIDACAQLFHAALPAGSVEDVSYMVVKWEDFVFNNLITAQELWCQVVLGDNSPTTEFLNGKFKLFTPDGNLVAEINSGLMKGLNLKRANTLQQMVEKAGDPKAASESAILIILRSSARSEVAGIMAGYLQQLFCTILKMPLAELDINEPLMNLGMDSLVAIGAKTIIEKEFGISLPVEILIEGPSVRGLVDSLLPLLALDINKTASPEKEPLETNHQAVYQMDPNLWIMHRKSNSFAKVKLFCFPYGGGGASAFRGWQVKLPDFIEVCPVQLPGRENRIKEKGFTNINTLVEILAKVIESELDRPYAFYGHSMGALIAYRLAYQLWENGGNKPAHLLVGAYSSPSILPNPALKLMIEKFKTIGFDDVPGPEIASSVTPAKLKKIAKFFDTIFGNSLETVVNEELARLLLPQQLSELQIVKSHVSNSAILFDLPITAFHGNKDQVVNEQEMNAWKELTKGSFTLHLIDYPICFLMKIRIKKNYWR